MENEPNTLFTVFHQHSACLKSEVVRGGTGVRSGGGRDWAGGVSDVARLTTDNILVFVGFLGVAKPFHHERHEHLVMLLSVCRRRLVRPFLREEELL